FVGYQHSTNHNAFTQWGRVPTLLERAGDFSQTTDAVGNPVTIYNPATHLPFAGNKVPVGTQAAALLNLYPTPNGSSGFYNYSAPVLTRTAQDSMQSRFTKNINIRNQVYGNLAFAHTTTDATNLFGFRDETIVTGLDGSINWSHRLGPFLFAHFK